MVVLAEESDSLDSVPTKHMTCPCYIPSHWAVHCLLIERELCARYLQGAGEHCLVGQGGGQRGGD